MRVETFCTRPTGITGATPRAIEIIFDPSRVTCRDLLEFYFQIPDHIESSWQRHRHKLRSAIFYTSDEQIA